MFRSVWKLGIWRLEARQLEARQLEARCLELQKLQNFSARFAVDQALTFESSAEFGAQI